MPKKRPTARAREPNPVVARVLEKLKEKKLSRKEASLKAGHNREMIDDWVKRPHVLPRIDSLEDLAQVLDTTPEHLAFNVKETAARRERGLLRVRGDVAAGLWHEVDAYIQDDVYPDVPVHAHPGYPASAQYCLRVRGSSVNKVAHDGDWLHCVDVAKADLTPANGDLVIAEMHRFQRSEIQVTAKRYRKTAKGVELAPDSSDEKWQEPLTLPPPDDEGDLDIQVVAIVIGVYKSLRR